MLEQFSHAFRIANIAERRHQIQPRILVAQFALDTEQVALRFVQRDQALSGTSCAPPAGIVPIRWIRERTRDQHTAAGYAVHNGFFVKLHLRAAQ